MFGYFDAEQYVELSYKVQATPWMFVTPDFQYLIDPVTFSAKKYPNAVVIGGATGISLLSSDAWTINDVQRFSSGETRGRMPKIS